MPIRLTNLKLSPSSPDMQPAESTAINKTAQVPLVPSVRKKMKLATLLCRCQPPESGRGGEIIFGCRTIKTLCLAFRKCSGKAPERLLWLQFLGNSCLEIPSHTWPIIPRHGWFSPSCPKSWEPFVNLSQTWAQIVAQEGSWEQGLGTGRAGTAGAAAASTQQFFWGQSCCAPSSAPAPAPPAVPHCHLCSSTVSTRGGAGSCWHLLGEYSTAAANNHFFRTYWQD